MESEVLKNTLKTYNILTDDDIDAFIRLAIPKTLQKSDYYIKEGEVCNSVCFVLSGLLRSYYITEKGDDMTYCITFPHNFMSAYSSFLTGQATQENLQAIQTTELLVIPKDHMEKLSQTSSNWIQFQKVIAEQQYIELEKRIFLLQGSNATKRYVELVKNHPSYLQNIPLQYLASYLGVTQRHLSRIRKEFAF
ncbi:Crp/Fnr family transcriptional regulator [Tamlana sp. s12]|uniref:Crp/Fnr family transcriptional regulator n=1 Tax=Tamlana sp. s12 TaxID=1630406 RepID=UPI0008023076|nr:Crp/Fnr family transcriptional regulator [Tamlana sp. s12]OBQ51658.1 cAMP-binding protein [Tamlana sp. s12]QQY83269.1 Crp/Fnr family transcriptional regulator [Tamlana sp. s12]